MERDCYFGIDDSGKCPVLGSYFIAGVMIEKKLLPKFKHAKDCKLLTNAQNELWARKIKKAAEFIGLYEINAEQISQTTPQSNLNDLIMQGVCKLILRVSSNRIQRISIDNWEHDLNHFYARMANMKSPELSGRCLIEKLWEIPQVKIEHHADEKYKECTLAGIVAKHYRDHCMSWLNEIYGFGVGGNPNDKKVEAFIRQHLNHNPKCNSGCQFIRWNWKTIERLRGCV
jgi:ribonuclease HII